MIRRMYFVAAIVSLTLASLAPHAARGQASGETTELIRKPEAVTAYTEGVRLLGEGKHSAGLGELNKAIMIDPTYPEAYFAKGEALKAMEDYQSAGTAYSRALEYDPNSAAAYNGRGECFMEMSPPDYNLAINDFTNALNLDRSNPAALSNMGHVLSITGQNPNDAIRVLDEALALRAADARALRDRGLSRAQMREFDKAEADLQQAIQVDAADYENYSTLATIYQYQEKYAEAADAIGKAIENYRQKKRGDSESFVRGYIYRADARLKVAEAEKDDAKRTAALEGVVADADAVLKVYDDRFPDSGYALFRRGRAERMLERYSDAVDSFTKAIQLVPGGQDIDYISDAYLFRGISWYYIGSLDLARGDFEQASALGTGFQDPRIFLWIGFTYHRQKDYRRAIDSYSEAIAKAPGFSLAHVNKGRAYMDLGEFDKAIVSFNNAIRSEPDVGDHYYNVGLAYIKRQEYQRAVDFLNLALRKKDPSPKMYRAMATALRGLGRDELATEYDQQAANPGAAVGAAGAVAAPQPAVQ